MTRHQSNGHYKAVVESRDLVSKVSGLEALNIAKKWFIEIYIIQRFFVCCIFKQETTKTRRKNARNLKKNLTQKW